MSRPPRSMAALTLALAAAAAWAASSANAFSPPGVVRDRSVRRGSSSLWARKQPPAPAPEASFDDTTASLTEKVISGGKTKRRGGGFKRPSVSAPAASIPAVPKLPSPPNIGVSASAASSLAQTAAAPALGLAALAALRSSLITAKKEREEKQRQKQEEIDKAKPLPQAGVLPVYDVPSLLRSGVGRATKTVGSTVGKAVGEQSKKVLETERAKKLTQRTSELNKELNERAANLNKRQIALMKDKENKAVSELGKTVKKSVGKTVESAKKVNLKEVNLKVPKPPSDLKVPKPPPNLKVPNLPKVESMKPAYIFPKADPFSEMNINATTRVAGVAAAGAAGLAIFAANSGNDAPDVVAPEPTPPPPVPALPPPAPVPAVAQTPPPVPVVAERPPIVEEVAKQDESAAPAPSKAVTATAPSVPLEKKTAPSSTAVTKAAATIKESSFALPASGLDRDAVIKAESFGAVVLLAVAFRNAGGARRAAEAALEEETPATTESQAPSDDDEVGGKTLLEKISVDASESSALVRSIQDQIDDIDAKLASFSDDEVRELLQSQKRDLEEMLCFALDNDL